MVVVGSRCGWFGIPHKVSGCRGLRFGCRGVKVWVVWGLDFNFLGSGFKMLGSRLEVLDFGCVVQGLGLKLIHTLRQVKSKP